jgi:pimeloyl-ACP methyl ester carboxylesterase
MKKSRGFRSVLKLLALGCATVALLFGVLVIWIGVQIYQTTRPLELSDHHPFRSQAKKQRYLENYDARAERWPVAFETRMVDTSWGATFIRISGPADGPPLVLLPGANATSLMWEPNIEAFSRDHRVYAVDNVFDFGRSVYVRNFKTPGDFVSWLDELLDGLSLETIRLMGLSYGGWISSEYALEHPERVEKLVLIAPAATVLDFSPDFIKKGILCLIPHPHFIKSMVHWAMADAAAGTDATRRIVEEAADNAWLGMRCFKPKQMVPPRILSDEELGSLAPPTLYLVGVNEVIYSGSGAEAVARLNDVAPQIETVLVQDCGHDLTLVQPTIVNAKILEFIDRGTEVSDPETSF